MPFDNGIYLQTIKQKYYEEKNLSISVHLLQYWLICAGYHRKMEVPERASEQPWRSLFTSKRVLSVYGG